jgi:hypothetical protein
MHKKLNKNKKIKLRKMIKSLIKKAKNYKINHFKKMNIPIDQNHLKKRKHKIRFKVYLYKNIKL